MESLNSSTDSCRIQLRARGQLFMLPVIVTPLAGPRSRHTAITPAQRAREPASSYWNTLYSRASNEGSLVFTITEKPPILAFSLLKVPTTAFTVKNLLRQALRHGVDVKFGHKHKNHKGWGD